MNSSDDLRVVWRHGRWEQAFHLAVAANQHLVEVPDGQRIFTKRIRNEFVQCMAVGLDAHFAGDWEGDAVLLETTNAQ
jgi:hypothetical protein